MTEISAAKIPAAKITTAEISEYEKSGFVVLRQRIDRTLVKEARVAVALGMDEARKINMENNAFITAYEDKNWPSECQALFEAIEVGV